MVAELPGKRQVRRGRPAVETTTTGVAAFSDGSGQLVDHFLVLTHDLSESVVDEGIGDPEVIGDHLHTLNLFQILVRTADRVDLLRRAPHQHEAAQISTGWPKDGHVKALDPAFLLKTPPVLQCFVVDLEGTLLAPVHRISPSYA